MWWSALALGRDGCQESRLELGRVSDPHVAPVLVVGRPGDARIYLCQVSRLERCGLSRPHTLTFVMRLSRIHDFACISMWQESRLGPCGVHTLRSVMEGCSGERALAT